MGSQCAHDLAATLSCNMLEASGIAIWLCAGTGGLAVAVIGAATFGSGRLGTSDREVTIELRGRSMSDAFMHRVERNSGRGER